LLPQRLSDMSRYLVTGGCGFIGSHLVDALHASGAQVRILDNLSTGTLDYMPPGAELVLGDVADWRTVDAAMHGMDGCFHLAAVASVEKANSDWLGTHRTNLVGTITVFEAARRAASEPIPVIVRRQPCFPSVRGYNPAAVVCLWCRQTRLRNAWRGSE
jgi:UDP-glucose 4-epimerase